MVRVGDVLTQITNRVLIDPERGFDSLGLDLIVVSFPVIVADFPGFAFGSHLETPVDLFLGFGEASKLVLVEHDGAGCVEGVLFEVCLVVARERVDLAIFELDNAGDVCENVTIMGNDEDAFVK